MYGSDGISYNLDHHKSRGALINIFQYFSICIPTTLNVLTLINMTTLTGVSLEIDPLSLRTSLARNQYISPMLWAALLLQGTAMSTN